MLSHPFDKQSNVFFPYDLVRAPKVLQIRLELAPVAELKNKQNQGHGKTCILADIPTDFISLNRIMVSRAWDRGNPSNALLVISSIVSTVCETTAATATFTDKISLCG